jgi:hypothetical protein
MLLVASYSTTTACGANVVYVCVGLFVHVVEASTALVDAIVYVKVVELVTVI